MLATKSANRQLNPPPTHAVPYNILKAEDDDANYDSLAHYAVVLESHFPRAVPEAILIKNVTKILANHGFTADTAINLVSTCRDEICRPFIEQLDQVWGNSFNISSLAGFCFCGRTGFKAAMAHAPIVDGIERYVFWVAPHIGLTLEGEVGKVYRPGREMVSSACGAMIAVHNELKSGKINSSLDPLDIEQSLFRQQLINSLHYGHVPDLVELTYRAYETIFAEVHKLAAASTDPLKCEYVIIAGIQVHGPLDQNFFWPGKMVKIAQGGVETDIYEEYAELVEASNPNAPLAASTELQTWCLNTALADLHLQRRKIRLAAAMGNVGELKRASISLPSVTDNQRRSLMHVAAMHGQMAVAKMLFDLDKGLISRQDINQMLPIDYAVQAGHTGMAEFLHENGGGFAGDRLVDQMVHAVETGDVEKFKALFRFAKDGRDAAAHATDKDGRSLLHLCLSRLHKRPAGEDKSAPISPEDAKALQDDAMLQELLSCGVDWDSEMDFFGNSVHAEIKRSCTESVAKQLEKQLASPALHAQPSNRLGVV